MTKHLRLTTLFAVLLLAACGSGENMREKLGIKSSPPDEFSVVTRAPLSVPPDYTLRPPLPGADRPNEVSVRDQARQTVFGADSGARASASATGQEDFLKKLGADQADPSIRASIDTEVKAMDEAEQPAAQKLLFWKDKSAVGSKPIDPVAEQKRLEAEKKDKNVPDKITIEKRNEDVLQAQ